MAVGADAPRSADADQNANLSDRAQDAAQQAQAKAGDVAGNVQDQLQDAANRASEQAHAALGQGQDRVREQIDSRSTQVGEQINSQASDLRSIGDALREKGEDSPAKLADRLAGYAEQAGGYLTGADADTILSDAEDYGRQHPGTVALGALAVGFAASRFLKASSSRRYASRGTSSSRPSADAYTTSPADPYTGASSPEQYATGETYNAPDPDIPPAVIVEES
jgi:ElaB/YqjD/DUF883 family membrane-anchored ribosome-binding protein